MREIRTLELQQSDVPVSWFIDRTHTLRVCQGLLWLTLEGELDDRWLRAGDSVTLPANSTIWISSPEADSRFALASTPTKPWVGLIAFYWPRIAFGRGRARVL